MFYETGALAIPGDSIFTKQIDRPWRQVPSLFRQRRIGRSWALHNNTKVHREKVQACLSTAMAECQASRVSRQPHAPSAGCAKKFGFAKVSIFRRAARVRKFLGTKHPHGNPHASTEKPAPRNQTARPSRARPAIREASIQR